MTNPMFNPQPNYSGVTIQISNPAVNVGGIHFPLFFTITQSSGIITIG